MTFDIVDILVEEFGKTEVEDSEENYRNFIRDFEATHNIIVEGEISGGCWNTIGYGFIDPADEVVFKLKYL